MGDLHVNISDLHDKFGDDFGCDDGQYFDNLVMWLMILVMIVMMVCRF